MSKEARTQEDLVLQDLKPALLTEKLTVPGAKELHTLPKEELSEQLAKVLLQVLKSKPNLRELRYVLGEGFHVTYEPATRY